MIVADDKYAVFISGLGLWIAAGSLWILSKSIRVAVLGSYCELCGEGFQDELSSRKCVGHHVKRLSVAEKNRLNGSRGYVENNWSNCMNRHFACERKSHEDYPDALGNNPDLLKRHNTSNQLILAAFCYSKNLFRNRHKILRICLYHPGFISYSEYVGVEAKNFLSGSVEDPRIYGIDYLWRVERSIAPHFSQNFLTVSPA